MNLFFFVIWNGSFWTTYVLYLSSLKDLHSSLQPFTKSKRYGTWLLIEWWIRLNSSSKKPWKTRITRAKTWNTQAKFELDTVWQFETRWNSNLLKSELHCKCYVDIITINWINFDSFSNSKESQWDQSKD